MPKENWNAVSRQHPCPICERADNCSMSIDGGAVYCGRVEQGSVGQNAGGQYLHIIGDGKQRRDEYEHPSHRRERVEPEKSKGHIDFGHVARTASCRADAPQRRQELADVLGVAVAALDRLRVGPWGHKDGLHWLWPERNAAGDVIGLNRRYRDGSKIAWPGSRRGLIYCDDWQDADGPVYLVEGPSDTAAMLSMGLCVVGRPSNTGGVELLIELLANVPHEQEVIVLGENDRKPHESLKPNAKARHRVDCEGCSLCWPGQYGATQTATKLAEQLRRDIEVMFPPIGCKDVREMVRMLEAVR